MKILYVEDNDDNVYMLKNRLSRAGFTVVVATDGAQGVAGGAGLGRRVRYLTTNIRKISLRLDELMVETTDSEKRKLI